ncbi:MAG: hypothetical protein QMC95_02955 [Desulfitobacteriaceae bacterium]|nr:hypothetical protein [Desulfitobacteriaceae bacterium]MDI6913163.1 hypothetical protein [Desulfitobacteriaceae bacterium]
MADDHAVLRKDLRVLLKREEVEKFYHDHRNLNCSPSVEKNQYIYEKALLTKIAPKA